MRQASNQAPDSSNRFGDPMTTNTTLIHGTARLFVDGNCDRTESGFATLKGSANFELLGPIGLQQMKVDVAASPEVIDGRRVYRLTVGPFDGSMHRTAEDLSDCRVYLGHVGPFDEFLVVGLLRNATEGLPAHIELTFTSTENACREASAETTTALQPIEF
jgi:hypothetical protein